MNLNHVIAVFKAEYYTTTSKFREYRKYIPVIFILGVGLFSYFLRVIYDFFRQDINIIEPPVTTFFSVIVIFTYFTLFAPLLSPLGRVVYDGGARSRRAVALNAPVEAKDLLYGNLLSNLAFFLPFFGFIGTLTLAPFIGVGIYSPFITSLALFGILSLLILIGLVAGTLISPLIFSMISSQRNSHVRAIIAFSISAMMVLSLPIMRYFLENTTLEANFGWVTYLPFTLAAILIIFVLYGTAIGIAPQLAFLLLILYIFTIFLIGYYSADNLYEMENNQNQIALANPDGVNERLLSIIVQPIPNRMATIVKSTMKASLRDIEHLSRLTIGLSITVFMIFALSSRGLFRNTAAFNQQIELAVIVFALVLSSASVIFIEASSFTIQHRDMFALIKSAPNGARKFVVGKAIQMVILLIPVFVGIIFVLTGFGFISTGNSIALSFIVVLVLILMTTLSLAIYLINPSDNEEDLGNFLNLLIFYMLSFIVAVFPVIVIIAEIQLNIWHLMAITGGILLVSLFLLYLASEALEKMNLETLNSKLSRSIIQGFKVILLFIVSWNILPLFGLTYFLATQDFVGFNILVYFIILLIVTIYYLTNRSQLTLPKVSNKNLRHTFTYLVIMITLGIMFSFISTLIDSPTVNIGLNIPIQTHTTLLFGVVGGIVIIEELYFRGMIFEYSRLNMSIFASIILNAILFGFLHIISVIAFINAIVQAMILCFIKYKTESVMYPIIAHLIYNYLFLSIIIFI